MKKSNRAVRTLALLFFLLITMIAIQNRKIVFNSVVDLKNGEESFPEFVDGLETSYLSEFSYKNSFINLNGLFARLMGKRTDNGIVMLNNGALTFEEIEEAQLSAQTDKIIEFSNVLHKKEIPFLYVQAPYKVDLNDEVLPKGVKNFTNTNTNQFVKTLEENGVQILDLRTWISANRNQVEQYFYRTDHHWNAEGAFVGYQKIVESVRKVFPQADIDDRTIDIGSWTQHRLTDWFLGTHGKRVGSYFVGTDDLTYYTPDFRTEMSCAIPSGKVIYKGNYSDANLRMEYAENRDYFNSNPYLIHIGGDYGLVQHRNLSASADLKLLLIKDSYMLPVQAYLSTVFKEIDVIDLRHYSEGTLLQYIESTNPDMVIMMYSDSSFGNTEMFEFGVKDDIDRSIQEELMIYEMQEDIIEAFDEKDNCSIIYSNLEANTKYTIEFEDVEFLTGESDGISVVVFDKELNGTIRSVILDIGYCEEQGKFEWTFITPEENSEALDIRIYSGIRGHAENKGIRIKNLLLYKNDKVME